MSFLKLIVKVVALPLLAILWVPAGLISAVVGGAIEVIAFIVAVVGAVVGAPAVALYWLTSKTMSW